MQQYETRVGDVFVISSNEAILSCSLPSHNAEFLTITSWVTNEGVNIDKNSLSGPVNPISQFLRTISGICSSKCKGENQIHEVYSSHLFQLWWSPTRYLSVITLVCSATLSCSNAMFRSQVLSLSIPGSS